MKCFNGHELENVDKGPCSLIECVDDLGVFYYATECPVSTGDPIYYCQDEAGLQHTDCTPCYDSDANIIGVVFD